MLGWCEYESPDEYLKKKIKTKIISGRSRGIDFISCTLLSPVNSSKKKFWAEPSWDQTQTQVLVLYSIRKIISVSTCVCAYILENWLLWLLSDWSTL